MNKKEIEDYILKYRSSYSQREIVAKLVESGVLEHEAVDVYDSLKSSKDYDKRCLIYGLIGFFLPFLSFVLTLILGIAAIASGGDSLSLVYILSIGFTIISTIFAIMSVVSFFKSRKSGMAITGLVFAILRLVWTIGLIVIMIFAGVMIQTASSLQSESLDVGRVTQDRITTDIEVIQVYANDTSNGVINNGDKITIVMRLGSGSAPIKLDDLVLKMDTRLGSQTLNHGSGNASSEMFAVGYISGGGEPVASGYLSTGDLTQISFLNLNEVFSEESITVRLLTKNGFVKPVELFVPPSMSEVTTYLYP